MARSAAAAVEAASLPVIPERIFLTGGLWLSDPRSPETVERDGVPDRGGYVGWQEIELHPDGRWNVLLTTTDHTEEIWIEGDATTPAVVLLDVLLRAPAPWR
ncbi:MAG: hypothetical protein M3R02_15655 [Chloroflexota bacterium]|nr:hypothetical protein [Chloroflexota bacterium]